MGKVITLLFQLKKVNKNEEKITVPNLVQKL